MKKIKITAKDIKDSQERCLKLGEKLNIFIKENSVNTYEGFVIFSLICQESINKILQLGWEELNDLSSKTIKKPSTNKEEKEEDYMDYILKESIILNNLSEVQSKLKQFLSKDVAYITRHMIAIRKITNDK